MKITQLKRANFEGREETQKFESFFDSALAHRADGAESAATILDSVSKESSIEMPKNLATLLDRMPDDAEGNSTKKEVMASILDGIAAYTDEHGAPPRADMIEAAVQQGLACFDPKDIEGKKIFDSATSSAHDQISLQPNRAVTAIIRTLAEAIPFAGYLPVDIGSNQAKIIIAQTRAGSAFGDFPLNGTMEGIKLGGNYAMASRIAAMVNTANVWGVQFFTKNLTTGEPDTTSTAVAILRGRTIIYVGGVPAAFESKDINNNTGATSPINGSVVINGTTYVLTGTSTPATGTISLTSAPNLPNGTVVHAEAFIDYDAAPGLIPLVNVIATTYDLFAVENRVYTANAFGAASQMRNEAGLDPESLATAKFQDQHTMERYYKFLKLARIQGSMQNTVTFDFSFTARGTQLTRAMIIQDLAATIGKASQAMANATQDCGITHIFTGAFMGSIFDGCPDFIWKPSGVPKRAGIYKLGTLFSAYEVYYAPNVVVEAPDGSASELLCIGTSAQPARNAFMMGDAVPPTLLPLATNPDFKRQAGFYVRNITSMNPHVPSALRCALIPVINILAAD